MKILAACLGVVVSLSAQTQPEFWPGTRYDPAIPTFQKVLGYAPGERISSHANIMRYFDALAAAAPGRIKVFEYAKSWEGRKLIYAAVGSEANLRRIGEIQAGMKKLRDPRRTNETEAKKLIANLPALVWLAYGVHGNEISSPDAAMLTAYHLLAARNDRIVSEILANTLVLINPTQNPDGRDRFVHNFETAEGIWADPNPLAAEHNEPWPGGRTNHYYFDLNRDWFALTQPETRGHVQALQQWYPLVFVDLHEMGGDATYYFAPEAIPYNPHLAKDQKEALYWFGKNNAKWFDQYGFNYFTREVYDAFYPGYGASWPSYYGGVAMTYEQASSRGLAWRRADDTSFTFRDTVREHFVASVSTAETAAAHRADLLDAFYRYQTTAIQEGSSEPVREYILPRRGDVAAVDQLAHLLAEQGIEVRRATAAFSNGGKQYPEGSYAVTLAQPAKRFIRTLLDPNVALGDEFMKEQERRRKRKLSTEIYDVTAWSLPMNYNIECIGAAAVSDGKFEMVDPARRIGGTVTGENATVAWLVPWGTLAAGRFLTAALAENLSILSTDKEFTQAKRKYPRGTLILMTKQNGPGLPAAVKRIADKTGAEVVATDSGWVDDGVNFGSRYVSRLRRPEIAIAWDSPTSSGSAGQVRYILEREYGYPVTVIRTQQLATADLSRFHVLILPEGGFFGGGYANVIGPAGIPRLKSWVAAGGTLVGLGSAVSFLSDPRVGLLSISPENAAVEAPTTGGGAAARRPENAGPTAAPGSGAGAAGALTDPRVAGKIFATEADYLKALRADNESLDSSEGAILRAKLDPESWLTSGASESVNVLVRGSTVYTPVKLDKGVNAGVFEAADKLIASGSFWEENRKQFAFKPFLVLQREGRGNVIGFTQDPSFRAYMDGLHTLLINAVFRGPAHARGGGGFGEEQK